MGEYVTLPERKAAKVAGIKAAVEELAPILADYARAHGGRFILFGSAARGDVRYDSDVDILVDFPIEAELDAWLFAESACFERKLKPDLHIGAWCADHFVERVERGPGTAVRDSRWPDVFSSAQSAARHFEAASRILTRDDFDGREDTGYINAMAFFHAMQSGHTALEASLLQALQILGEGEPTGASWHADLIERCSSGATARPPIFSHQLAIAAQETRMFRHRATYSAARAHITFSKERAQKAVSAGERIAAELEPALRAFADIIDPD